VCQYPADQYPVYMLQVKTKGKVCVHTLPRATAILEPASLLMEGSSAATYPRLWTPPFCLGGLRRDVPRGSGPPPRHPGRAWRCHTSLSTRPRLTAKEGSGTNMCPSALDCTHLSDGLRCLHVSHGYHRPWTVEEGLAATTCPRVTEVPARRVGRQHYHDL
jgi:hypothetical protein